MKSHFLLLDKTAGFPTCDSLVILTIGFEVVVPVACNIQSLRFRLLLVAL